MKVLDVVAFLEGSWSLERVITDRLAPLAGLPGQGRFEGVAVLELCEGRDRSGSGQRLARYVETGTLSWGDHCGPAERRLSLAAGRAGGGAEWRFSDGRRYVDLDLSSGSWRAEHLCGADRYGVETVVLDEDRFEERWEVRGPEKYYDAVTSYLRLPRVPVSWSAPSG